MYFTGLVVKFLCLVSQNVFYMCAVQYISVDFAIVIIFSRLRGGIP